MPTETKLTVEKRMEFFDILRDTANVSLAAKTVGVCRARVYQVRDHDEGFRAEWDRAVNEALGDDEEALEDQKEWQ